MDNFSALEEAFLREIAEEDKEQAGSIKGASPASSTSSVSVTSAPSKIAKISKKFKKKKKAKKGKKGKGGGDNNGNQVQRRQRVVWDTALHNKFLNAIEKLGYDKAFPRNILDTMNVPGITRENVASHLQKYRLFIRKMVAESNQSIPCFSSHSGPISPYVMDKFQNEMGASFLWACHDMMLPCPGQMVHMENQNTPNHVPSLNQTQMGNPTSRFVFEQPPVFGPEHSQDGQPRYDLDMLDELYPLQQNDGNSTLLIDQNLRTCPLEGNIRQNQQVQPDQFSCCQLEIFNALNIHGQNNHWNIGNEGLYNELQQIAEVNPNNYVDLQLSDTGVLYGPIIGSVNNTVSGNILLSGANDRQQSNGIYSEDHSVSEDNSTIFSYNNQGSDSSSDKNNLNPTENQFCSLNQQDDLLFLEKDFSMDIDLLGSVNGATTLADDSPPDKFSGDDLDDMFLNLADLDLSSYYLFNGGNGSNDGAAN